MTDGTDSGAAAVDKGEILRFLDLLAAGAAGHLALWSLPSGGRGLFYAPGEQAAIARDAVQLDAAGEHSIYLRMTTVDPARITKPGSRGGAEASAELLCLWSDLDIAGPGHKSKGDLPPDEDACRRIIATSSLPEPSAWVHSGGGMYALWILATPTTITTAHPAISERWQQEIARASNALGYEYGTGVHDLARVLRLPGTVNRKPGTEPRPARLLSADGPRYTLGQLAAALPPEPPRTAPAAAAPFTGLRPSSPLDDYESRVTWDDILIPQGWTYDHADALGTRYWARPGGSSTGQHSASSDRPGDGRSRLYVFSDATGLPQNTPLTKPFVTAHYHTGGDMTALAATLRANGYGAAPTPAPPVPHGLTAPAGFSTPSAAEASAAGGSATDLLAPLNMTATFTALATIDKPARLDELRRLAPRLITLPKGDLVKWRAEVKSFPDLTLGEFDAILEEAHQAARAQRAGSLVERLEQRGGRELAPPVNPMAVARELLAELPSTDGIPHRGHWRGDFYQWAGAHWTSIDEADVRHWVYDRTEHAYFRSGTEEGEPKVEQWLPNQRKVNGVLDALGAGVLHRPTDAEHEPAIALTNGVYDLATSSLQAHHPGRWNLTSLPYAYDPAATCPQWIAFLQEVLPADSAIFLQEWMGYLISGGTEQQKIASLIGRPRSGKGTIARVITALLGHQAVTGPTLGSLIGPFGLEPLLGKSLAVFADVKWSARGVGDATELLKTISGEDGVSVGRKNRTAWEGKLPTRFMLMSNDTPSFTDASGALGNRLIHVHFTRSFLGREKIGLTDQLLAEMSGILLWAIAGLRRLNARGRFHVPAASAAIDEDVRRTSAPHAVFIEERCVIDPAARVDLNVLWVAWQAWCREGGTEPGSRDWMTRKLKAVEPELASEEVKSGGVRQKFLCGIRLDGPETPRTMPAFIPQFPGLN